MYNILSQTYVHVLVLVLYLFAQCKLWILLMLGPYFIESQGLMLCTVDRSKEIRDMENCCNET